MAPRKKAAREPEVAELLGEEITHLLMRADHVEPRTVRALVEQLRSERGQGSGSGRAKEDRS
jgi:hypothetical protein